MYEKIKKKFFALLMTVCIVASYTPGLVYAETENIEEPTQIEEELQDEVMTDSEIEEDVEAPEEVTEEPVQDEEPSEEISEPEETSEAVPEEPVEEVTEPEETLDAPVVENNEETETQEEVFVPDKADYLSYDPLYVNKYANSKYVDVSKTVIGDYLNIVTAAKGVATYNIHTQSDFEFKASNYIASINYEIPVYDVDHR